MTPSHKPRKRFGQHFLDSPSVLTRIIHCIAPQPDDALVEIGPGHGALTQALVDKAGSLDAIEVDRDLATELKTLYSDNQLRLHVCDVLNFDFSKLHQGKKLKIVGNLPYNISTPLLFHLFDSINHIQDMYFTLQLETAQRLAAVPNTKNYSRLSVVAACYVQTEHLFTIDAEAFAPPPKVTSAFVRLTPQPRLNNAAQRKQLDKLSRIAFSQRRKKLKSTFSGLISERIFRDLDIDPNARVETLTVDELLNMLEYIPHE